MTSQRESESGVSSRICCERGKSCSLDMNSSPSQVRVSFPNSKFQYRRLKRQNRINKEQECTVYSCDAGYLGLADTLATSKIIELTFATGLRLPMKSFFHVAHHSQR